MAWHSRGQPWIPILGIGLLAGGSLVLADPPSSPPARDAEAGVEAGRPAQLDPKAMAKLSLEHARVRDALLAAEARMALLMEKVFGSRLVVRYRGDLNRPFELARVELFLDGALAYRRIFDRAASVQAINLFDGYLPPGRHVLRLRVYARGPDDPPEGLPGYFAGCGLAVHMREGADTVAAFEAEQDGDSPGRAVLQQEEPGGSWETEIEGSYETTLR